MTVLVSGSVADRPWGRTFAALGLRAVTGQLTLHADGKRFQVAFDHGAVVAAASPLAADAAVRVALTAHLISSSQVPELSRRQAAAPGRDEIDVIAELARLGPEHALRLRRRAIAQRAARTFALPQGDFVVSDEIELPLTAGCELDVRAVIYIGARAHLAEQRLAAELDHLGAWFRLKPALDDELPQFGFTDLEQPIVERLRDGGTIQELEDFAASFVDSRTVRAVVYALTVYNACDVELVPPGGRSPAATAKASQPLQRLTQPVPTIPSAIGSVTQPLPRVAAQQAPATRPPGAESPRQPKPTPGGSVRRTDTQSLPVQSTGRLPTASALRRSSPALASGSIGLPPLDDYLAIPTELQLPEVPDVDSAAWGGGGAPPRERRETPTRDDSIDSIVRFRRDTPSSSGLAAGVRGDGAGSQRGQSGSDPALRRPSEDALRGGAASSQRLRRPSEDLARAEALESQRGRRSSGSDAALRRPSEDALQVETDPHRARRASEGALRPEVADAQGRRAPETPRDAADLQRAQRGGGSEPPRLADGSSRADLGAAPRERRNTATRAGGGEPPGRPVDDPAPDGVMRRRIPPSAQPARELVRGDSPRSHEVKALIAQRLKLLEQGADHFQLLGVAHDVPPDALRRTYFALARQLHPDRLAALGISDDGKHAQRLFAQINSGFAVLSDQARKADYLSVLRRGGEAAIRAEQARAEDLARRILEAEEAYRRGEMALRRDQPQAAIGELERAVQLNPDEADHHALLAWARFVAAPDKAALASVTRLALDKALQRSPKAVTARFYLGRVERMLGRDAEALRHFRDVLASAPGHTDAAAEVRVLESRIGDKPGQSRR